MNGSDISLQSGSNGANVKVTREDWLRVALDTLVSDGVEQVKVLPLGQRLGVSRSSFYWYFKSRQDLLDQLLDHWQKTNTRAIVERTERPAASISEGVLNVFECWIDEELFDPRLDFAVREWARRSGPVRHIVDQADEQRVQALTALFLRHGYEPTDGFIRARILYFMQIGYYALDLAEPQSKRLSYLAAYLRGFTGEEPDPALLQRFQLFARRFDKQREGS